MCWHFITYFLVAQCLQCLCEKPLQSLRSPSSETTAKFPSFLSCLTPLCSPIVCVAYKLKTMYRFQHFSLPSHFRVQEKAAITPVLAIHRFCFFPMETPGCRLAVWRDHTWSREADGERRRASPRSPAIPLPSGDPASLRKPLREQRERHQRM